MKESEIFDFKENNEVEIFNVSEKIKEEYRKTIFLYSESKIGKIKKNNEYVRYTNYELGITNPELYHKQLISEGYFEPAKLEEKLNVLKVTELKDILKQHNLTCTGKKEELIKTIIEEIPCEKIDISKEEYYSLSEKGKNYINKNINYVELHRHQFWQISLEDYCKEISNDTYKRTFNDIARAIFDKRIIQYSTNKEYMNLRFTYFRMADLLKKENRNKEALNFYLYCLIYDLSAIESIELLSHYEMGILDKNQVIEYIDHCCFNQSLINQIVELKEEYDEEMLSEAYNFIKLPFNVSSLQYLKSMLDEAFTSAIFDFKKHEDLLLKNKKELYLKLMDEADIKDSKKETNMKYTKLSNASIENSIKKTKHKTINKDIGLISILINSGIIFYAIGSPLLLLGLVSLIGGAGLASLIIFIPCFILLYCGYNFKKREKQNHITDVLNNNRNELDVITYFVLCFSFGYFGIHKFYRKKYGMGLLYLFTFGLFGLGWIIDIIKSLTNLIKIRTKLINLFR